MKKQKKTLVTSGVITLLKDTQRWVDSVGLHVATCETLRKYASLFRAQGNHVACAYLHAIEALQHGPTKKGAMLATRCLTTLYQHGTHMKDTEVPAPISDWVIAECKKLIRRYDTRPLPWGAYKVGHRFARLYDNKRSACGEAARLHACGHKMWVTHKGYIKFRSDTNPFALVLRDEERQTP